MDLENICRQTISLAKKVGKFIHEENKKLTEASVKFKGKNNLVTYVDTTSEKMLVEGLRSIVPTAAFLTEENTETSEGELRWIIDPLDGTTNYVHSVPFYSISIALMEKGKVIMGLVYGICQDESFYAWKDSKAYLNGDEITVSQTSVFKNALMATGFPYSNLSRIDPYIDLLKYLMNHSQGVRRLGSAALDLAYVACGRFEGFYEYSLQPWDVAAGSLIVQRAGGKVADFKGKDDYIFGQEIVATNALIYDDLLEAIYQFFPKKGLGQLFTK